MTAERSRWSAPAKHAEAEIQARITRCRNITRGAWRMENAMNLEDVEAGFPDRRASGGSSTAGSGGTMLAGVSGGKEFDVFYGVDEWTLQQTRGDFVVG